ncbi:DUF7002 family protein [Pseudomonas sp. NPDC090202]|uniref:DUF7002 family protein n=1 Tax=unclassified Pseudomonas TaxID=196821 RepID=UPI00381182D4
MLARKRSLNRVYHLLDIRNWASVQAHGLLSTARLAQLSDNQAPHQLSIQRLVEERFSCGAYVRDQRPMPPRALMRCLTSGVRPEDWYRLLNSRVFFWIDAKRLSRQHLACGDRDQMVLVIDAQRLLEVHAERAAVSPINTGNALRAAAPRNLSTFVPYASWVDDGWAHERIPHAAPRSATHKPVELTVAEAVPDVCDYVIEVVSLKAGQAFA